MNYIIENFFGKTCSRVTVVFSASVVDLYNHDGFKSLSIEFVRAIADSDELVLGEGGEQTVIL